MFDTPYSGVVRQEASDRVRAAGIQDRLFILAVLLLGIVVTVVVAATAAEMGVLFVIPLVALIPAGLFLIRYPFAAVMLWLLIFPFVVRGSSAYDVPIYYALHRILIPGTLWLVIVRSWARGRDRKVVQFGLPEYVMVLSLSWALGSILILGQQSPIRSAVDLYDELFVPYCMYWLIRLVAPTSDDLRRFLPVVFFALMAQAIIGILSWFAPHTLPEAWLGDAGERVVGTFRNPAVYTSTILFLALLIFQYGINSKSFRYRALALVTIGIAFLCVAISFSRGSWLGGLLVLLGLVIIYRSVLLPVITIGLILGVVVGGSVLSRELSFAYERLNDQQTAESRVLTGARSLRMIESKPLFGWGVGNYDLYDDEFAVQIPNSPASLKESGHTSHNTYLTLMAEQGIPALFLYLFPAAAWLVASAAVRRRLPVRGFWSRSLLALFWLVMLDHVTVSSFMDMIRFNLFGTTIWWMTLALIANMVAPFLHQPRHELAQLKTPPAVQEMRARLWRHDWTDRE